MASMIAHMAGMIQRHSWSIEQFLGIYDGNATPFHRLYWQKSSATIWSLPLDSYSPMASIFLGIFAFLGPGLVPQELLQPAEVSGISETLECVLDGLNFFDDVEPLLTLSLIKRRLEAKECLSSSPCSNVLYKTVVALRSLNSFSFISSQDMLWYHFTISRLRTMIMVRQIQISNLFYTTSLLVLLSETYDIS